MITDWTAVESLKGGKSHAGRGNSENGHVLYSGY